MNVFVGSFAHSLGEWKMHVHESVAAGRAAVRGGRPGVGRVPMAPHTQDRELGRGLFMLADWDHSHGHLVEGPRLQWVATCVCYTAIDL
jgi:hypothetical protein